MVSLVPRQAVPRPFLKWAGGKGKLISQYRPYFPDRFETYYEPFLGGGAVFFSLLPARAVLTDINPELVNIYRCVRDNVEQVITQLEQHQKQHCQDYYYQLRARQGLDSIEGAARLLYLNKTCFNGLYRENAKGEFNVPIGRYKNPKICNPDLLRSASKALQNTDIQVRLFESILDEAKTEADFVYFDPPYYPISPTSNFTSYDRHSFSAADQVKLRDVFVTLARRNVRVMLSNSDCAFIRDLYREFAPQVHVIYAARAVNSNARKRGKIPELLITSY